MWNHDFTFRGKAQNVILKPNNFATLLWWIESLFLEDEAVVDDHYFMRARYDQRSKISDANAVYMTSFFVSNSTRA